MICLQPVTVENLGDFAGTSYDDMSREEKLAMIGESLRREHEGSYFELLAVCDGDRIVGFMNLCAHSAHIISISPEIKRELRARGYAFLGETQALRYAAERGYTIAVAGVREDNAASLALHRKLGFEEGAQVLSRTGKPLRFCVRTL